MAGKPTRETSQTGDAGVTLGVADSPADLIAVDRLRARAGLERDGYDTRALQICAWEGDTLVGTQRLVLPMPGKRLPVEEGFGLTVEPAGEAVDLGPPALATALGAERAKRVADGLLAQACFETRARGYVVMAGIASSRMAERYRALGLDVDVLGRLGDRTAVRLDPSLG